MALLGFALPLVCFLPLSCSKEEESIVGVKSLEAEQIEVKYIKHTKLIGCKVTPSWHLC